MTAAAGTPGGGWGHLPWPGEELVLRVAGGADRSAFYESGRESVADIERVLGLVGRTLPSYRTVLDFGCGCGRILMWVRDAAPASSLHGVDIDERAIRWVRANLPGVTAKVNDTLPPLDYPDATFDLVYNHSVFTHIDEDDQDAWLQELSRVTKPGGHLLLTFHGARALDAFESHSAMFGGDDWVRQQVRRHGIAFIKEDAFAGGPFPDSYHSTYHAPWYVLDRWGKVFDVKGLVPGGSLGFQDVVVLERRADDTPPPKPIGPLPPASSEVKASFDNDSHDGAPVPPPAPIEATRALMARGPDLSDTTRWGPAARGTRRLILRALRHYDDHQRRVHDGLLDAFGQARAELHQAERTLMEGLSAADGLSLREANGRLWEALRQQG
ncbi:MAG TPA: class I SAM-dependent methyltransferase, partial [Acidimicrobiales bacterium]|nr:class I SAM-dependent methyltransferase [Acidimicrobiales bacterium]